MTIVLFTSITGIAGARVIARRRPPPGVAGRRAARASGWILTVGAYFTLFWSVAGQTPGMRLLRIRVIDSAGGNPSTGRAFVRFVGLVLSIMPMFAGFVPVLFTERRRGLRDFLAEPSSSTATRPCPPLPLPAGSACRVIALGVEQSSRPMPGRRSGTGRCRQASAWRAGQAISFGLLIM